MRIELKRNVEQSFFSSYLTSPNEAVALDARTGRRLALHATANERHDRRRGRITWRIMPLKSCIVRLPRRVA